MQTRAFPTLLPIRLCSVAFPPGANDPSSEQYVNNCSHVDLSGVSVMQTRAFPILLPIRLCSVAFPSSETDPYLNSTLITAKRDGDPRLSNPSSNKAVRSKQLEIKMDTE
jgi:hypothetical protein